MHNLSSANISKQKPLIIAVVAALVIFGFFLYKGWDGKVNNRIDEAVTITGSFTCLPYKVPSPEDKCILGFMSSKKDVYALDISHVQDVNFDLKAEDKVLVTGTVIPLGATSTEDWIQYDIKGVLRVSTLLRTR